MKRTLAIILVIMTVFSLAPGALAENETEDTTQQSVPVTAIKMAKKASIIISDLTELGNSVLLEPAVYPENAADKTLLWTSSDEAVATVDQTGLITSKGLGTAVITCIAADSSGVSAACTVTVRGTPVTKIAMAKTALITIDTETDLGKQITLETAVYPDNATDKTLLWTSSNEDVATVDETGVITSKGFGSTVITCTAMDGSKRYARCSLSVKGESVRSIKLPKTAFIDIGAGEQLGKTVQLEYTVDADKALDPTVSFTSSNESVATVDQFGLVTSVGFGKCVITLRANDNSMSAKCTLTVKGHPVKRVTLNAKAITIEGGETHSLIATVLPADATKKDLKYFTSNANIASVDSTGLITGYRKGTVKITVTSCDGSNKRAVCTVKVVSNAANAPDYDDGIAYTGNVYQLYTRLSSMEETAVKRYIQGLGDGKGAQIVKTAAQYLGVGYIYMDCAVLTRTVYSKCGINIGSRSDRQGKKMWRYRIDQNDLSIGDLMFFRHPDGFDCPCRGECWRYKKIHHVGIYAGYIDGCQYIIDASSSIGKIVIRKWGGGEDFAEMKLVFCAHRYRG